MDVEIVWQPVDQDHPQTLYADLNQASINEIEKARREDPDGVIFIPCRARKNGPTTNWMFRVRRIMEVRRV